MTALANKTILVTGASGSLGAATARILAEDGATVILLGKTVAKLEKVYDEIVAAGGAKPAIYPLDLAGASEADYHELAQTIERELGGLQGLIHTAAHMGYLEPLEQVSAAVWQQSLMVNLTAPFVLTRVLLPQLLKAQGTVVFTTDTSAQTGLAYWGPYAIAKAGLEKMVTLLTHEHEGKLQVHLHEPGPMASTLRRKAFPGEVLDTLPTPAVSAARIRDLLLARHP